MDWFYLSSYPLSIYRGNISGQESSQESNDIKDIREEQSFQQMSDSE